MDNDTQCIGIPKLVNFVQEFLYYLLLVPAVIIIISYSLCIKRTKYKKDLLGGRPALPIPVNLLYEQENRSMYVACFLLTGCTLITLITSTGSLVSSWNVTEQRHILKSITFVIFLFCLLIGLTFYPLFGGLSMKGWSGIVAFFYVWVLATLNAFLSSLRIIHLKNLISVDTDYTRHNSNSTCPSWDFDLNYNYLYNHRCTCIYYGMDVINNMSSRNFFLPIENEPSEEIWLMLDILPTFIMLLYLSIFIPRIAWTSTFHAKKRTGNEYLQDNRMKFVVTHVKELLKRRDDQTCQQLPSFGKRVTNKIYTKNQGFRYSLSMVSAISVSILLIYKITVMLCFLIPLNIFQMMENKLTDLLTSLRDKVAMGNKTTDANTDLLIKEIPFWIHSVKVTFFTSVILAFFICSASILTTMKRYQHHMLSLYKGIRREIPQFNNSATNTTVMGAKYIGYQLAYATWGYAIQAVSFFFLILLIYAAIAITIRYQVNWILNKFLKIMLPIGFSMLVVLIFQKGLVHFFLLQRNAKGERVLAVDNLRAFANYQYFMVFGNAPLGLISCFLRIAKAVIFGLWSLPRLDISTLSRSFESYDGGFVAYVSLLEMENAHTNPVLIVFVNLICDTMKHVKQHHLCFSENGTVNTVMKELTEKQASYRKRLVRNRWCLFITLHNNPGLRLSRKSALGIKFTLTNFGMSSILQTIGVQRNYDVSNNNDVLNDLD